MKKQKLITDYYQSINQNSESISTDTNSDRAHDQINIIRGYNELTDSWHCLICGQDMGRHNPRQLCRKTYCENE